MPRVDMGNGNVVDFPENLSSGDLNKAVASAVQQLNQSAPDNRSILKRGWDALTVPEQKSREGLKMISGAIPEQPIQSQSAALNFIAGVPHVAADTMAEAAPGFVSRGAILTAGAAKAAGAIAPVAKMALRAIGSQGEELSGIAPKAAGALEAAYQDSSILKATKKAASPYYEAAKQELGEAGNIFKGMYKPQEIVDAAKSYLGKGGVLEPAEALMARKATDLLMKGNNVKDELMGLRNTFDEMAKASSNISEADMLHQRGRFGEVLQKFAPQNKYGGASAFKMGIATVIPKSLAALALSPRVQGLAAAGTGIAARQALAPLAAAPANAAALYTALRAVLERRRQQNAPAQ